jgi:hypothetical protein
MQMNKERIPNVVVFKGNGTEIWFVLPMNKPMYLENVLVLHTFRKKNSFPPITITERSIIFDRPPHKGAKITVSYSYEK